MAFSGKSVHSVSVQQQMRRGQKRKPVNSKRRTLPGFAGVYASAKGIARWKAAWVR